MAHRIRTSALACLLLLAVAFAGFGCAAQQPVADITIAQAQPLAARPAGEKQAMLDYLKLARADFALIEEIIADKELGLLEDASSGEGEDLTPEMSAKYQGILQGYTQRLDTALGEIKARTAPNHPDIESFRQAELAEFQLLDDIITEYNQVLLYADALITMGTNIEALSTTQQDDLQKMYDAYSTGINAEIKRLQGIDVPSFYKNTNDNIVAALQQMDQAVLYALNAVAMEDPVRADSADYRMGILQRQLEKIGKEAEKDMTDRQTKLKHDSQDVQQTGNSLKNWLDNNIAKLESK